MLSIKSDFFKFKLKITPKLFEIFIITLHIQNV